MGVLHSRHTQTMHRQTGTRRKAHTHTPWRWTLVSLPCWQPTHTAQNCWNHFHMLRMHHFLNDACWGFHGFPSTVTVQKRGNKRQLHWAGHNNAICSQNISSCPSLCWILLVTNIPWVHAWPQSWKATLTKILSFVCVLPGTRNVSPQYLIFQAWQLGFIWDQMNPFFTLVLDVVSGYLWTVQPWLKFLGTEMTVVRQARHSMQSFVNDNAAEIPRNNTQRSITRCKSQCCLWWTWVECAQTEGSRRWTSGRQ